MAAATTEQHFSASHYALHPENIHQQPRLLISQYRRPRVRTDRQGRVAQVTGQCKQVKSGLVPAFTGGVLSPFVFRGHDLVFVRRRFRGFMAASQLARQDGNDRLVSMDLTNFRV
eukprot:3476416-Rhodomonas_salina.1